MWLQLHRCPVRWQLHSVTALSFTITLHLLSLMPFHPGVIVAACTALGLVLSVPLLVGRRDRSYDAHALSSVNRRKCPAHVRRLVSEVVQTINRAKRALRGAVNMRKVSQS